MVGFGAFQNSWGSGDALSGGLICPTVLVTDLGLLDVTSGPLTFPRISAFGYLATKARLLGRFE
jgi:hypothetical protein